MRRLEWNVGPSFDPPTLLDRASELGAAQAEVFATGSLSTPITFENNRLRSALASETGGVAVRVVKDGRMGFATSSRPGDHEVVDLAVRAAQFGPEAGGAFGAVASVHADLDLHDPAVVAWTPAAMLDAGAALVETLRAVEDGVMTTVLMDRDLQYVRVANSVGQDVWIEATAAVCTAAIEMTEGDNMIQVWHFSGSRRLDLDLRALGERVTWLYRQARRNVLVRSGAYPVIFTPTALSHLVNPLAACLDGKAVAKGESPWKDRVGTAVLSKGFTLIDDATLPWGLRTTPFDDEGVPTTRRAVIQGGVLQGFFLDLRSGHALGQASTGNGYRATLQAIPAPRSANLVLEPGSNPAAELVAGVRDGLYVVDLMGAWAGNPYAGQISGNVLTGFRIENGEITGRVKDCVLSVNAFEALGGRLQALSRERETASGGQFLPYALIDGVTVSAKA